MYEVTFLDNHRTVYWTLAQCEEHFGKDEFQEYLAGYLPHVVVVQLDDE